MVLLRFDSLLTLTLCLVGGAAYGGAVRYDLPELLGELRYDGNHALPFGRMAHVDTSFGLYSVSHARLVVEGTVFPGKAHGDGTIREPQNFDLLPSVTAQPSFSNTFTFPLQPTPESFRLEQVYPAPFAPETTPLPNPDGYPPIISFDVRVSVGLALINNFPPLVVQPEPGELIFVTDGIVVDVPIIAEITDAYVVLSGANIVPEPSGLFAAILALVMLASCARG